MRENFSASCVPSEHWIDIRADTQNDNQMRNRKSLILHAKHIHITLQFNEKLSHRKTTSVCCRPIKFCEKFLIFQTKNLFALDPTTVPNVARVSATIKLVRKIFGHGKSMNKHHVERNELEFDRRIVCEVQQQRVQSWHRTDLHRTLSRLIKNFFLFDANFCTIERR